MKKCNVKKIAFAVFALTMCAINCAPARTAHGISFAPEGESLGAGRIGIIEPDMILYNISLGGVSEYRDDWSSAASRQTAMSAALALKKMGYTPRIIPDPNRTKETFFLKAQMRYHSIAFLDNFFANANIRERDGLIFSIGRQDEICNRFNLDALLYIYGYEENFSNERQQSLDNARDANTVSKTFVASLLADCGGRVLWHNHILTAQNFDMRDPAHSLRIINSLIDR